jgi:hypothetical protein
MRSRRRARTVDVHAHCAVPKATSLLEQQVNPAALELDGQSLSDPWAFSGQQRLREVVPRHGFSDAASRAYRRTRPSATPTRVGRAGTKRRLINRPSVRLPSGSILSVNPEPAGSL